MSKINKNKEYEQLRQDLSKIMLNYFKETENRESMLHNIFFYICDISFENELTIPEILGSWQSAQFLFQNMIMCADEDEDEDKEGYDDEEKSF